MNTFHAHHRTASAAIAGLFGLTFIALAPAPAQASRIPADPITFVATPVQLAQFVSGDHAANVRAGMQDLWADLAGQ